MRIRMRKKMCQGDEMYYYYYYLINNIKVLCLRKFHQTWVCAVCLDFIDSSQPAVQLSSDSYSNAVKS